MKRKDKTYQQELTELRKENDRHQKLIGQVKQRLTRHASQKLIGQVKHILSGHVKQRLTGHVRQKIIHRNYKGQIK